MGTAVVRWPGPILVASIAVSLVGLLALPSYKTSYDERKYIPADIEANRGYAAADRHFASLSDSQIACIASASRGVSRCWFHCAKVGAAAAAAQPEAGSTANTT